MTDLSDVSAESPDPIGGEPTRPGPTGPEPTRPEPTGPDEPAGRTSRAGRNLGAAIVVGLVLFGLVLLTAYRLPTAFVVVVVAALLVAVVELVTVLMSSGVRPPRLPLLAGTVAMAVCAWKGDGTGLLVAYVATVLVAVFWRVPADPAGSVRDISAAVWVATYVPLLGGFALLMFAQPEGADRVVLFIATTIASDIGGYATGVVAGRHPMAPRVSPKKSWEGFAGSVIACLLVGALVGHWLLDLQVWQGLVLGAAVVVTATMGDLAESTVKRDLGVKDLGRTLPGHGGLMDRLDSLLPVAPVAYVLLTLFAGS
jgi:phosphatidate cytidylyltransferase